jgi:hypothetical protein
LAKAVHRRQEIKLSGVHFAWTGSILFWLVSYWWFTFFLSSVEEWTVPLFLFVLIYGAFIYFLIALLYPGKNVSGTDQLEYFIDSRKWFFSTFVALGFLDLADTWIKSVYEVPVPPLIPYLTLMVSWLVLGTIGAFTANRTYHRIFAYAWLTAFAVWVIWVFAI